MRLPPSGLLLLATLAVPVIPAAAAQKALPHASRHATPAAAPAAGETERIVAVVNGDAITNGDVAARGRLFALSTGLPMTPEVLERLRPQITRQLIDEQLRMQAEQKAQIVVTDKEVAAAIQEIEARNHMEPGTLSARLAGQGVTLRTLIHEIRTQIGWTRLLRDQLGNRAEITDAEIAQRMKAIEAEKGKPQYHVAEIFIPVEQAAHGEDARRFADTVITQLRGGAPFAVVAAQFSQSQSALQGGDMGWLRADEMDPEVAKLAAEMPAGAISNPVPVAGGYAIVTVLGKREVGRDMATVLSVRQAFFPFATTLDPKAPTAQQQHLLEQATQLSRTARSCDAIEAANKAAGAVRPSDPGQVALDQVQPPQLRTLLASLPPGKASQPLVATNGIMVMMVCAREEKNVAQPTKDTVKEALLTERVELLSRQLQRSLRRDAVIDRRTS